MKFVGENTANQLLNNLKEKFKNKANTTYVDTKIEEAITKVLNTEV